ncbi:ribosome recycling factor [Oenococcus oeni]|uniref:ribosome recycling factor n=1 Tax=Oenococcus oeni TaxID=1247 RepID=UPI000277B92B|nr:ribosome recycling factor [Oenococcus oeni]EJO01780.1 ribosome recycling factor [Oenococcus oeni AWRIB418]OIM40126.1 ribosome recycling factor [Oenococcus oeni]QGR01383.1 ribosome recycling factor [Oenococcus oeni]TEU23558.1 ribosome recycling factor [Oenococcus oeni]TEU55462.1 ribosome recycling factor [Oenococcus oeni]
MIDLKEVKERMGKVSKAFQNELINIRAGRANPNILNKIQVEYYGAPTPLNQLASVQIPEARVLLITPYDKTSLKAIEQAIFASDLGLTPQNDGSAIRLIIPQLTEDSRKELVKQVKAEAEKAKVAARNTRHDFMSDLKKDNDLSEDSRYRTEDDIQKATDLEIKDIDRIADIKEKELMEI